MGGVVLGLAGALAAGVAAACSSSASDSTAPRAAAGPRLQLTLSAAPSDSLAQLGVSLFVARSDSAPLQQVRIWIDSAAGGPLSLADDAHCRGAESSHLYWAVVGLPGPGRHTLTVVGVDASGQALSASATWTVRVPDETYSATPLPDSGAGGGTRFVHANGTVTGWVVGASGRRRPALWRGGALSIVGAVDTLDGAATRVNAAGDVLIEDSRDTTIYTGERYASPRGVRVRRADGRVFPVGPNLRPSIYGPAAACCTAGVALTESRLALGESPNSGGDPYPVGPNQGPYGAGVYVSAVLDVARGVRTDSMDASFVALNEAGQGLGVYTSPGLHVASTLVTRGFELHALPTEDPGGGRTCDPHASQYSAGPLPDFSAIDLDESANVLASSGRSPFWLPASGAPGRWLDRVLGPSRSIHLSRTGQIVASLSSTGAVYLWRAATNRVTQARIAGDAWQIDALAAVNASGQIAAHGVERTTGRTAALLLTPAP